MIDKPKDSYLRVESEQLPVWADEQQVTFFEDNLKLTWINNSYRLTSPQGILNPIITQKDLLRQDIGN